MSTGQQSGELSGDVAPVAVPAMRAAGAMSVDEIHAAHGDFVWASLQRLGARQPHLEDLFQEVFVVVHRRLATFEERAQITTWLFGVCRRVVAAHRRRAHVRLEQPTSDAAERAAANDAEPEAELLRKQAAARLSAVLDAMDLDKRAILLMSVVEEVPSQEIADTLGIPVGTVYSRVSAARKQFDQILARLVQQDRKDEGR